MTPALAPCCMPTGLCLCLHYLVQAVTAAVWEWPVSPVSPPQSPFCACSNVMSLMQKPGHCSLSRLFLLPSSFLELHANPAESPGHLAHCCVAAGCHSTVQPLRDASSGLVLVTLLSAVFTPQFPLLAHGGRGVRALSH